MSMATVRCEIIDTPHVTYNESPFERDRPYSMFAADWCEGVKDVRIVHYTARATHFYVSGDNHERELKARFPNLYSQMDVIMRREVGRAKACYTVTLQFQTDPVFDELFGLLLDEHTQRYESKIRNLESTARGLSEDLVVWSMRCNKLEIQLARHNRSAWRKLVDWFKGV